MTHLSSTDRYVILREGVPVFATNTLDDVLTWLWGRQLRFHYVVLDYERPYPLDNPDLLEWIKCLEG